MPRLTSLTEQLLLQPTGWYSYRISKAAQNQFTRTVALGQALPACIPPLPLPLLLCG